MPFESITPGGGSRPGSSPETGSTSSSSATGSPRPGESPAAQAGVVSVDDALKGGDHAKMNVFSVSDLSKGSAGSGPSVAPGSSVSLGGLVQGKVVVDLADSLIPALLVLLLHRMKLDSRKSQFQLTQGEKNTLAPIVEACLQSINLDFSSPWTTLTVSLLVIYGGKIAEVAGTSFLDKKAAEKAPASEGPKQPQPRKTQAPEPVMSKASMNNESFASAMDVVSSDGPPTWTEADVAAVVRKRKCSKAKAIEWLDMNWRKKNGRQ